jgi:hypothetical protein
MYSGGRRPRRNSGGRHAKINPDTQQRRALAEAQQRQAPAGAQHPTHPWVQKFFPVPEAAGNGRRLPRSLTAFLSGGGVASATLSSAGSGAMGGWLDGWAGEQKKDGKVRSVQRLF